MGDECALLSPAFGHQVECTISPLVVFSVLDHYMRRSEGQERVIGTLLGANNDGHLEITNCFPVPHTEGETVGIDMDFHKTMFGLHRQANNAEIIVGWYSTGDVINEHSILIHDFYGREIQRPPIHVCIGTDLASGAGITMAAYMATTVMLKDKVFGSHFAQIPCELSLDGTLGLAVTAIAGNAVATVDQSLAELSAVLQKMQEYVARVKSGAQPGDASVGRQLLAATHEFVGGQGGVYSDTLQDVLSVLYLGKLTRAQLVACQQLHALMTKSAK